MKKQFIEQLFLFSLGVSCIAQADVSPFEMKNHVNDAILIDQTKGCSGAFPICCTEGPRGPRGVTGPRGPRGRRGPAGMTTPQAYGYILNLTAQTVINESAITFDSHYFTPVGIEHTLGSGDVIVISSGIYAITFYVDFQNNFTSTATFGLYINGVSASDQQWAVTGQISGEAELGQAHGTALLSLTAGDALSLRNVSGVTIVVTPNGNGLMCASFVIERIA